MRQLGHVEDGLKLLNNHVISKYVINDSLHQFRFNKLTYSPYLYPTALYEKTMFTWLWELVHRARLILARLHKKVEAGLKELKLLVKVITN